MNNLTIHNNYYEVHPISNFIHNFERLCFITFEIIMKFSEVNKGKYNILAIFIVGREEHIISCFIWHLSIFPTVDIHINFSQTPGFHNCYSWNVIFFLNCYGPYKYVIMLNIKQNWMWPTLIPILVFDLYW